MGNLEKYSKEFDDLVDEYNKWLESPRTFGSSFLNGLFDFAKGFSSVFDFSGNSPKIEHYQWHPIYSRKDLTPSQKDAIALASNFKRVEKSLETEMHEGKLSFDEFKSSKDFIQEIYNNYKDSYISQK